MNKIKSLISFLFQTKSLFIILILLGITFRFVNLDQKIYWRDEALTSLQISGFTQQELVQQVFNGKIITPEDLQKYQQITADKSFIDTVNSLATETPEHPPLYYIMLRIWRETFGNSVVVIRSLSVLISLLAFPCIYWLCLELFQSPLVGWIAVGLIAVSPFYVQYSQQAREYSFWILTTLLASVLLLRAMRLQTKISWVLYAAMLVIGVYCHVFFVFFILGYTLYVLILSNFQFTKTVKAYLLASLAAFITFIPWILTTIYHLPELRRSMAWTNQTASPKELLIKWLSNIISLIFVNYYQDTPQILSQFLFRLLLLFTTILVGYSIYFICCHTEKKVWLFVLILMFSTPLPLILPDIISGGIRSTIGRYWIPCYLGINLSLAYLLVTKIISGNTALTRNIWKIITVIVISGGVISGVFYLNTRISGSNFSEIDRVARVINQSKQPLVVGNSYKYNPTELLSLSYYLDSKVRLLLVRESDLPNIPNQFSDVFIYSYFGLPPAWQDGLPKKYKIEPIKNIGNFWKVKKIED